MKQKFAYFSIVATLVLAVVAYFWYRAQSRQQTLDRSIVKVAKEGRFSEIRDLLSQGANPNGKHFPEPNGSLKYPYRSPIYYACQAGDIPTVTLLLNAGVDIKEKRLESTLLQIAIENRDKKLFKFLLGRNANPNVAPPGSIDFNVLGQIVDCSWSNDWRVEETLGFAELAMEYGADVNQHGMHGFTALHYAVSWEMTDLVKLFLDNGGLIEAEDNKGWDSMDVVAFRSNKAIVDLLVQHGGKYTVQEAVCTGQENDVVELLKSDPAAVGNTYIGGNSLLGLALSRGYLNMSKNLIQAGSDLSHLNNDRDSLLHLAAKGGNAEMVAFLIDRGLDVNGRNASDCTPIHETTYSDRAEAAKVLISAGANTNARQASGITPTLWASSYDSPNVLKLLLAAGCAPDQTGANDSSVPLGSACHYSKTDFVPTSVRVLVASGADVNRIGSKGRPAIHWAVEWFGGVPLVQYLLDHGANPLLADSNGETALDIANRTGKTDVLNILNEWVKQNGQQMDELER